MESNQKPLRADVIAIAGQTIGLDTFMASKEECATITLAISTFRHLLVPSGGYAQATRCTFAQMADQIEAYYSLDDPKTAETVRVLRAAHNRFVAQGVPDSREFGVLAKKYGGVDLPVAVLRSGGGFYIGTSDRDGPCSRESQEYWPTREEAEIALGNQSWTQRLHP